jgi:hypothetical protein
LPKHADKKIQVIYQSIVDLGFNEMQVIKHFFILLGTQHLDHVNLSQFKYFEMLRKNIEKSMIILHVLMSRLIVLGGPKVVRTFFFIAILNMDLSIYKLNAHKSSLKYV